MTRTQSALVGLLLAVGASGCGSEVRALVAGEDSCHFCRMTIDDVRFGAMLISAKGRIDTFDSIECLASFVASLPDSTPPRGIFVADYEHPTHWLAVAQARFLHRSSLRSPMGRELAAINSTAPADSVQHRFGGRVISWNEVRAVVARATFTPGADSVVTALAAPGGPDTIFVAPAGETAGSDTATHALHLHSISDAVARVARGGVVRIAAGVYREPTLLVTRPMTLEGARGATLDGEGARELIVVGADSVTVRGLTLRYTGTSQATDRSALRVVEAAGCLIEDNHFENTLFGIYLQKARACLVRRNVLDGMAGSQTVTGNGLHLWASRDIVLEDNIIRGHRDGIYFEFVRNGIARRNVSERSHHYGLHFMFSDCCIYDGNTFRNNESGVAVMYSKHVNIVNNTFSHNRGSAAYGLLLKENTDSDVRRNRFDDNSIALYVEGSSRDSITDNDFVRNGWAVRVLADAQENLLRGNSFADNDFDVGTNSRMNYSTFEGNYWDRYRGYDLDHDGRGDVPHSPVRLFALLVAQAPPALILTRSILVDLLDVAERVLPALSPETLRDRAPLMHPLRRLP